MKLAASIMRQTNLSLSQLADMFGEYWVLEYSQKMYGQHYLKHATAKSFLLDMDNLHLAMTKNMANARPPRFTFTWKDERTLLMKYISSRNMADFAAGLVKGVGKFYHEKLDVKLIGNDQIQVIFP
ncbi:heme NO binding domain protein [Candidatus Moduliflexus flocculans]|uniref:Heme NO binding domain protein n=1 Tax=Candidatus Moduliflexus flocculans TaxID=1499966 RepID=A0A081BRA5_9BACT|nr:heme NO binding domain protein [Candidatus Moduliflexus flocculans]